MDVGRTDLSIVIVTWNASKYIRECLKSIDEQHTGLALETIVVDNASIDGTADLVRQEFSYVRLVQSDHNLGFAKANNVGIRLTRGKYIFLVNPDVIMLPGCLERLFRYMEENPSIGLLGPRMLGPDRAVQRSTMRFPSVWNSFCRALALDSIFKGSRTFGGFLMRDFGHDKTMDVDILNGWFWAARRESMNRVGLLDEQLFMYGDDLDWSFRFHQAGCRVVFYPEAEAIHFGGGTTERAPVRFYIEMYRANLQFWRTHYGRLKMFAYLLTVWLHEVVRVVGYGVVFLLKRSARQEAADKVKRSVACISWLAGGRATEKALP